MNLVRFHKPAYSFNVNALMNDMLNDFEYAKCGAGANFKPALNIKETDDAFKVEFMVPGYSKENISIKNKDGILTVKAEVDDKKDLSGYSRREFLVNSFERSLILPKNVDTQSIEAKYLDGILNISIPKKEIEKDKSELNIEIQ